MYLGIQVTLTDADTNYNLRNLVEVLIGRAISQSCVLELLVQSDSGNSGTVLVGDGLLSATRYGYSLAVGESRLYRVRIPVAALYFRSGIAGNKMNIELIRF